MARRAVVHFALLGAVLFACTRWLGTAGEAGTPRIPPALGAALDEEVLYQSALANRLDRDDPVVQARLVRDMQFLDGGATDGAALYRDAARLGLASDDLVIRRRLIERMRMRLQDSALAAEPAEAELQVYLDNHRQCFRIPARVGLTQVFVGRQRHGAATDADATRLRDDLTAADVGRAAELGDPLPLPAHLPSASEQDLARLFGAEFAAAAMRLEPGRWQGPLRSPYGLHVVWVHDHTPATDPPLDAVRAAVRAALREERAAAAVRAGIAALRTDRGASGG
jgi:hypothetical protein